MSTAGFLLLILESVCENRTIWDYPTCTKCLLPTSYNSSYRLLWRGTNEELSFKINPYSRPHGYILSVHKISPIID